MKYKVGGGLVFIDLILKNNSDYFSLISVYLICINQYILWVEHLKLEELLKKKEVEKCQNYSRSY